MFESKFLFPGETFKLNPNSWGFSTYRIMDEFDRNFSDEMSIWVIPSHVEKKLPNQVTIKISDLPR